MLTDPRVSTVVEGNALQGEMNLAVATPDTIHYIAQVFIATAASSEVGQAAFEIQYEPNSSFTTTTAISRNLQSAAQVDLGGISNVYLITEPDDLPREDQWIQATTSQLRFEVNLREFQIGTTRTSRPSLPALTTARRLLRAIEQLDRPAIVVDDDGVLSLDLRLNSQQQMFIDLLPDNQVEATVYDEAAQRLSNVVVSTTAELINVIEAH